MEKPLEYLNLNFNDKYNKRIFYSCGKCNLLPVLLDVNPLSFFYISYLNITNTIN